jgi:hypothetical protein
MSPQLADLLLNGAPENRADQPPAYDAAFVQKFLKAFGDEAAVYVGGPERQDVAGLVVHGCELTVRARHSCAQRASATHTHSNAYAYACRHARPHARTLPHVVRR